MSSVIPVSRFMRSSAPMLATRRFDRAEFRIFKEPGCLLHGEGGHGLRNAAAYFFTSRRATWFLRKNPVDRGLELARWIASTISVHSHWNRGRGGVESSGRA